MDRGGWQAIQSMGSQRVGHDLATTHTRWPVPRGVFRLQLRGPQIPKKKKKTKNKHPKNYKL